MRFLKLGIFCMKLSIVNPESILLSSRWLLSLRFSLFSDKVSDLRFSYTFECSRTGSFFSCISFMLLISLTSHLVSCLRNLVRLNTNKMEDFMFSSVGSQSVSRVPSSDFRQILCPSCLYSSRIVFFLCHVPSLIFPIRGARASRFS